MSVKLYQSSIVLIQENVLEFYLHYHCPERDELSWAWGVTTQGDRVRKTFRKVIKFNWNRRAITMLSNAARIDGEEGLQAMIMLLAWGCHNTEMFSALVSLCEWNPPVSRVSSMRNTGNSMITLNLAWTGSWTNCQNIGIHRWTVDSPQKGPVTRQMFPLHDVIICRVVKPPLMIAFSCHDLTQCL